MTEYIEALVLAIAGLDGLGLQEATAEQIALLEECLHTLASLLYATQISRFVDGLKGVTHGNGLATESAILTSPGG